MGWRLCDRSSRNGQVEAVGPDDLTEAEHRTFRTPSTRRRLFERRLSGGDAISGLGGRAIFGLAGRSRLDAPRIPSKNRVYERRNGSFSADRCGCGLRQVHGRTMHGSDKHATALLTRASCKRHSGRFASASLWLRLSVTCGRGAGRAILSALSIGPGGDRSDRSKSLSLQGLSRTRRGQDGWLGDGAFRWSGSTDCDALGGAADGVGTTGHGRVGPCLL